MSKMKKVISLTEETVIKFLTERKGGWTSRIHIVSYVKIRQPQVPTNYIRDCLDVMVAEGQIETDHAQIFHRLTPKEGEAHADKET